VERVQLGLGPDEFFIAAFEQQMFFSRFRSERGNFSLKTFSLLACRQLLLEPGGSLQGDFRL
jgi:hypothetical protein